MEGRREGEKQMKLILQYLKPYKLFAVLAPLMMALEVASEVFIPKLMTKIINIGIIQKDSAYILRITVWMVLLVLIGTIGGALCLVFASKASQMAGRDLRKDAFIKIQNFSFDNIEHFTPSSLITRLTNDITQIQMIILMSLRLLVRAPLLSVGSILMAASIHKGLAMILVLMIPVVMLVMFFIVRKGMPLFRMVQGKLDQVNVVMRENLSGVRVIKAFVRRDYETEKFQIVNEDYKETTIRAFRVMIVMMPMMMLVLNSAIVILLWQGAIKVQIGAIAIGDIMALITYLMQIMMSLMMIGMVFMMTSRAKVSLERVSDILTERVDIIEPKMVKTPEIPMGKVEFRNVYFHYQGEESESVLEDISFLVQPGKTIAIIGETGAGKSTLVNLIPRLYDVTKGQILIDDVPVEDYDLQSLRKRVSVVLQEAILFTGTIEDNLRWGKIDATKEELIAAAKVAQAHDFIMELPNQYQTELGQKGINLSGGQKQRLSIARALVSQPKILIFDDSTSAVDMVTEKKLRLGLQEISSNCTKFIIAQRISSVQHADTILVLHSGKIVAQGNHETLLKESEEYQAIYESQMGEGAKIYE